MDYTERVTFTTVWETNATADNIQHWINVHTRPRRTPGQDGAMLASDPPLIIHFNLNENVCELIVIFPEQYYDQNDYPVEGFMLQHDYGDDDETDFIAQFIINEFPIEVGAKLITEPEWGYYETGPLAMPVDANPPPHPAAGAFGN